MSAKLCKPQHDEFRLPNLNKEILEVKKRIQLSEGQRKALFEEIANESKRDADEILRLKKEIAKVQLSIYEERNNVLGGLLPIVPPLPATVSSAPCKRVTQICGVTQKPRRSLTAGSNRSTGEECVKKLLSGIITNAGSQKSLKDIVEYLDLHRIDKNKQLDLLSYKYKQKESKLKSLAVKYQNLLIKKDVQSKEELQDERKAKNAILAKDYRNRINAVQVQVKEAEHVRVRYKDIRWKLQEDAAKFESKMADIELELKAQEAEIHKIKQVNKEALKLRSEARHALQKEERQVLAANATREKQTFEGTRLVEARQCDLAHLEKHFYQKKPQRPQDQQEINQEENDIIPLEEEAPKDPEQQLKEDIDILNEATGSSCIEEVLAKVKGQTTTQLRLMTLRKTKEKIKNAKQRKYDVTLHELEKLKFADDKSNQQNQDDVDDVKSKIQAENTTKKETDIKIDYINGIIEKIVDKLLNTYLCMYQEEDANVDQISAVELIKKINIGIENLQKDARERPATVEELLEEMNEREGNWLPEPYNDIVRRTPVINSGAPTPVPAQSVAGGSEDEEELPTRNYLKRQAQLVVDAKNKRKTMRFPIPKTK